MFAGNVACGRRAVGMRFSQPPYPRYLGGYISAKSVIYPPPITAGAYSSIDIQHRKPRYCMSASPKEETIKGCEGRGGVWLLVIPDGHKSDFLRMCKSILRLGRRWISSMIQQRELIAVLTPLWDSSHPTQSTRCGHAGLQYENPRWRYGRGQSQ